MNSHKHTVFLQFQDTIMSEQSTADTADTSNADSTVVESGPVEYADQDHDDIDDDEDEDVHLSAAQLMGQEYGHGEYSSNIKKN